MKHSVSIAELKTMSAREQERRVSELIRAARSAPNGEIEELDREIRAYEQRYGLDSASLEREVAGGHRQETEDICRWLMLLRIRERLEGR
jgi:hypothetical protein